MIIAIDGPAGSGKTTVAELLARKLDILYLDTGATYRVLTLKALEADVDLEDERTLSTLACTLDITLENERVYLDGGDVSSSIRTPIIDKNISKPVSLPMVRDAMVKLQRKLVERKSAVVEGRDITTVVFPKAEYKFFLDADIDVRATRRHRELRDRGIDIDFKAVKEQMRSRDHADLTRKVGPLKKTENVVCLDTTDLNVEQVVETILRHIKND